MESSAPPPCSLDAFLAGRRPPQDINREIAAGLSRLDKVAMAITTSVGSMAFFLAILAWTALWLGWNLFAPARLRFDPPMGFVFWLFISNVIQLLLMPLIMVGQNVLARHAEARAQHDFEINLQAEAEIEMVLRHLEYQTELLLLLAETGSVRCQTDTVSSARAASAT
jgi:uncharacterized membrane protein